MVTQEGREENGKVRVASNSSINSLVNELLSRKQDLSLSNIIITLTFVFITPVNIFYYKMLYMSHCYHGNVTPLSCDCVS